MAKGRKRGQREASAFSTGSAVLPSPVVRLALSSLQPLFQQVQDRRSFHPQGTARPPLKVSGKRTRIDVRRKPGARASMRPGLSSLSFQDPERVLVCVRRRTRRQVLFAKRKTWKGARGRRARNAWSRVSC